MSGKITNGIVAGLAGGIVFGIGMQMMKAPTPDGGAMPMMAMVAQVVGSTSLIVGWSYHLFNSALIGGLFGGLLGNQAHSYGRGVSFGALYGVAWWILGALILMPIFLGMSAFAPLAMAEMRPVAFGSLAGHLMFGVILGATFVALTRTEGQPREVARVRTA